MRLLIAILLWTMPLSAGMADPLIKPLRSAQMARLDNGLQLIVMSDDRTPVVTHTLAYKVGSRDDPVGKSGLAHYLEHLMFKKTARMPSGHYSATLEGWGGEYNAFTSYTATVYYATIPKEHLEALMAMEADRMQHLQITEQVAQIERDVVLEERFGSVDMHPQSLLQEQLIGTLYAKTPFATPIIGHEAEIRSYTHSDALGLYRQYYAPNNAVLVISGDIDFADARQLADKYYGPLRPQPRPEQARGMPPSAMEVPPIRLADTRTQQPSWQRMYRLPASATNILSTTTALDALTNILGGDEISRLFSNYVINDPLFLAMHAYTNTYTQGFVTTAIVAIPKPSQDMSDAARLVDKELQRLADEPVSSEELARSKTTLLSQLILEQDDLQATAMMYALALSNGYTLSDIHGMAATIEQLKPVDIQNAARLLLASPYIDGELVQAGDS